MSDISLKSNGRRYSHSLIAFCAAAAICAMVPTVTMAGGGGGPAKPSTAVKFEPVAGTHVKRVILTPMAERRLAIEVGKISEKPITLTQIVGGQITNPGDLQQKLMSRQNADGVQLAVAGQEPKPVIPPEVALQAGSTLISLTLSQEEWERVDKSAGARVAPLATRSQPAKAIEAKPAKLAPVYDPKSTMLTVHYFVPGKDHGLAQNQRVRVELTLNGSGQTSKVAPYGAVYYDGKGEPWVYVRTKPLTYERKPVVVERISGDDAVLREGPPLGTEVVSVGASLLYGAEVIYKR